MANLLLRFTLALFATTAVVACGDNYSETATPGDATGGTGGSGGSGSGNGDGGSGGKDGEAAPPQVVSSGREHSCAIVEGGEVRCWGVNNFGQLGNGTTDSQPSPVTVELSPGVPLTGANSLALGHEHSCAIMSEGTAFCWGSNQYGLLANADALVDPSIYFQANPVPLESSPGVPLTDVEAIASGLLHSCAIAKSGKVFCWGSNLNGEIGNGETKPQATPSAVALKQGATARKARSIAVGDGRSCAVTDADELLCWGAGRNSAIVLPSDAERSPHAVELSAGVPLTDVRDVAIAGDYTCVLRNDGSALCGTFSAIGDQPAWQRYQLAPLEASPGTPFTGAQALVVQGWLGKGRGCALRAGGEAFCWGANDSGQIGDGTTSERANPVAVKRKTDSPLNNVKLLAIGDTHVCAAVTPEKPDDEAATLVGGLELLCWGSNGSGQLGDGTTTKRVLPVTIELDPGLPLTGAGPAPRLSRPEGRPPRRAPVAFRA